jgi:hypothetical protein
MALPISIPYTFANATTSIPLSQLDTDFSTIYATVNGMGNGTIAFSNVLSTNTVTTPTLTSPTSTALTIQSAGTTAMTVSTSQNVGIGTTSPVDKLNISDGTATFQFKPVGGSAIGYFGMRTNSSLGFSINDTEAMRIDTSGNLLVGTTSQPNGTYPGRTVVNAGGAYGATYYSSVNPSGYTPVVFLGTGNALAGYINVSGTTSSFVGSSDYRLKKDIAPLTSGISTIAALKPVSYKWEADQSIGEGFIAHELGEVIPLALFGTKDAVNEDGSIKPQGIDMIKIVPHLVAALQELSAKNDALEARLAALEAK